METIMDAFVRQAPVAVMTRALLTRAVADSTLDDLFDRHAIVQYTRELTFSTLVGLMAQVTFGKQPTIHAAYRQAQERIPVSITAVYDKLNNVETTVVEALVRQTAESLGEILQALPLPREEAIAGLRLRMLDGNFLAGTEHRLDCLRDSGAAALPGMSLVVRDGASGLLTDIISCEDAYTNERSLFDRVLPLVRPNDLWLADRNFCTLDYLQGIAERDGFFLVRRHGGTRLTPVGDKEFIGSNETGDVYEQRVLASGKFECRCIAIELFEPMRDGTTQVCLLTNVPRSKAGAKRLAELYRRRWQIETAFQELTCNLRCEINTLGYPNAALFAFALAMVAYNAVVVVQCAVAAGQNKRREELSSYHLATEIAATAQGMEIALPEPAWAGFAKMSNREFAAWLHKVARTAKWDRYRKNKRPPTKNPTKINRTRRGSHRATARVLNQSREAP
jgi:DDE family transposase